MLMLVVLSSLLYAQDARLMRFPDIENGKIVFVYQNDLWLVSEAGGQAARLTVFPGLEMYPKFAPGGEEIAFSGNYQGTNNIFKIPVTGGEPKQITFHPAGATMVEWSQDGKKILYNSGRSSFVRFFTRFFEVDANGGPSNLLPIDSGSVASYSHDGSKLFFNRHPVRMWWWKRYKGSQNGDLWVMDRASGKIEQLTDWEGNDRYPMYAKNGQVYFISEREGISNIFSIDPATRKIVKITNHSKDGVQWPGIDSKGEKIVYECEGKLYVLDIASGASKEVKVKLSVDPNRPMVEYINPFNGFFDGASISPSGKRVAVSARGDVFSLPAENGVTRNLTSTSGARDSDVSWSPNGKYVAYVGDSSGEFEVYIVDQKAENAPVKLTASGEFKFGLKWSPDSKHILYNNNDNQLMLLDVEAKTEKAIISSKINGFQDYNWSNDSKWISYVMPQSNGYNHIVIYDVDKAEAHKVTDGIGNEGSPTFSPDGKFLYFLSRGRTFDANSNMVSQGPVALTTVMAMSLQKEKEQPFTKEDDEEPIVEEKKKEEKKEKAPADDGKKPEGKPENGKDKKDEKKEESLKIDFDGIVSRVRRLAVAPGNYFNLAVSNSHIYYMARAAGSRASSLKAWDLKALKESTILPVLDGYELNAKGNKILVIANRKIAIIPAGAPAKPGQGAVSTANMSMRIDRKAEWRQILNESLRMIRDYFYDEKLHGINYDELKEFYTSMLPYVTTREELSLLLQEVVGELNASHQGANGGDVVQVPRVNVALLGAELEPDAAAGYYKITKIFKGDKKHPQLRSPLDAEYVKVKEGDYLLKIDGKNIKADEDYTKYLTGLKGRISITTNAKPELEGAITTEIDSLNLFAEGNLRHLDWITGNKALVKKASNDRIGYVHITGMTGTGLEEFMQAISENYDKDGLILDVRYNGGGGIDPILIDVLERRAYQVTRFRGSETVWRPDSGFYGHVAVLINEHSYSDAEVFPNAFRVRKLGKVIGVPTLGFVVAVGGYQLMDNGNIRRTHTGLWDIYGNQMESRGALPDIEVKNDPNDVVKGKDAQLEAAINHLLGEIKAHPVKTPDDIKTEIKAR